MRMGALDVTTCEAQSWRGVVVVMLMVGCAFMHAARLPRNPPI